MKLATGAAGVLDTVTVCVLVLVPFASVTVSVTEYDPPAPYVWLVVFPEPLVASPNVQLYVAVACAVELLASKLQTSSEQLVVKLATGGCGPAAMNPLYSSRFGVPLGTPVITLAVALLVSAERTCDAVAVGFT